MNSSTIELFLFTLFLVLSFAYCFPRNYNAVQQSSDIRTFQQFKHFYKKQYPNAKAERKAREAFEEFLGHVRYDGETWYTYEITSVDDMPTEWPSRSVWKKKIDRSDSSHLREHFNWTEKLNLQYDEKLMYQGWCGNCWVFSAAAVIEANLARRCSHKPPVIVSRQELLDCSIKWAPNENHCGGDHVYPYKALEYAQNYGVHTENKYPYLENHMRKSHQCRHLDGNKTKHRPGVWQVRYGVSDAKLQEIIRNYGPVVVHIVPNNSFRSYRGGVLKSCKPGNQKDGHGVVVVGWGYDEQSRLPYWIVLNSWGYGWGEHGYARVHRNADCMGMNTYAFFLLNKGENNQCVYDAENVKGQN